MAPRQIHDLQQTYLFDYVAPEKEGVIVRRMPVDFRGGDNYQVVMDIEAPPEEIFDAMTNFEIMAETSHVILDVKVTERDEMRAFLEMKMIPEVHPGTFYYRYEFDRPNYRMHYWCYDVKGAGDKQVWESIDVEVHIYPFGKISRAILTENFTYCKGQTTPDATPIFTGVGHDILNRVKIIRERKK